MPAPLTTALLAFGAVLTAVSGPIGAIIAGVGLLFELVVAASTSTDGLR